jgi:hypothetical protein
MLLHGLFMVVRLTAKTQPIRTTAVNLRVLMDLVDEVEENRCVGSLRSC